MLVYIICTFILLITAFVIFRIIVRGDYRRRGKLTVLSTILEVLIFALHANFSYLFLPVKWPAMPPLPENPIHRIASLAVMIGGLLLTLGVMARFDFRRAVGQKVEGVYETGFYRFTRNPQIIAYTLVVVGYASLWRRGRLWVGCWCMLPLPT